ncbi:MAG: GNAT family N-acetyltransferase [Bacteroides sp.]|nr:GNAT family N-acetyltransferase [Bacteroides sp.]
MAQLEIIRYSPDMKREWDEFIDRSKNGTFLLKRDYMDYHADRFSDYSLIFSKGGSIQGVLPACKSDTALVSHGGLTYGGYIMSRKTTMEDTLRFFQMLISLLREEGFNELRIKPVPHIYHSLPSEEDLYALFRLEAQLIVRNVSATIFMPDRPTFRKDRKAGARRAESRGIRVMESTDYQSFWTILRDNLAAKYDASPVHSLEEIKKLSAAFPENIKLYEATMPNGEHVGGTVLFITPQVVHAQYISATPEGKKMGAVDILFDHLITDTYKNCRYFDFGTSNEDGGRVLNEPLICQKEGFGARAICYDTYSVKI